MNLLPKSSKEFSQKEYWNSFFKKRGKKAFEWYGEYPELCGQLHKYIKPKDNILMIGCGNSSLSTDLYDVGYKNITNIDISQVVIRQMGETNKIQRPEMKYLHMDALNMSFDNELFSVILDKGTLDALMPDDTPETLQQIDKLFNEINRVLKIGGRYVCISLLQEHILVKLLSYFPISNWMFRVVRCHEAEKKTAENGERAMPVFVVVCTKFKQLPQKVMEICLTGDKMERISTEKQFTDNISAVQQAALVLSGLNKNNLSDQDEISLELYQPNQTDPRFTIYVLDQPFQRENGQFAAFIVPQGRETEWLFSTKEGRLKLLKSANHNRLAIVLMHRGQKYESLDAVKEELSDNVKNLAPPGLTGMIPYLSLGSDVGQREIRFEGTSEFSGPFVVEDCTGENNEKFRRLIFLSNQFVVQSEAKLKNMKVKGKRKMVIDPGYLACQHHIYMSLGAYLNCSANILVIGLGGGGLCTFLNSCLPDSTITALEIDPAIFKVATDWFGLTPSEKLKVQIEDGLKYIENAAKEGMTFDAVLFDVDNKDTSIGMNCPPKAFIEPEVLENVKNCIGNKGIFVLNLVIRNESLRKPLIISLRNKFKNIVSYKLEEDLNEVIFCTNEKSNKKQITEKIKNAAVNYNEQVKKQKLRKDDLVDVNDLVEGLKVL